MFVFEETQSEPNKHQ